MSASTYTLIPGFKNGAPVGAISVWAKAFMTSNQLSILVGPRNARHRKFGQFQSYIFIFVRAKQLTHAKKLTMKRRNFEMSTQHFEHDVEHMVVDTAVERVELSYE